MATNVHLYMTPGSCSLASHILLRESGLSFTTTTINAAKGFPPEYLHLNPKGRVPILQLDDDLITETPAIFAAISQLAPTKNLLGQSPIEIVRTYEWVTWLCGTLHGQAFGCLFRPGRFVEDDKLFDAVKAKGRQTVRECFELIDGKLDGKMNAVGSGFTAVDAYLLVFYRWGNKVGFQMAQNYPNYTKLVQSVALMEAVKEAVGKEGISMFND